MDIRQLFLPFTFRYPCIISDLFLQVFVFITNVFQPITELPITTTLTTHCLQQEITKELIICLPACAFEKPRKALTAILGGALLLDRIQSRLFPCRGLFGGFR